MLFVSGTLLRHVATAARVTDRVIRGVAGATLGLLLLSLSAGSWVIIFDGGSALITALLTHQYALLGANAFTIAVGVLGARLALSGMDQSSTMLAKAIWERS